MTGIAQQEQKGVIFSVVSLLRIENIKEKWKKTPERYIQSIKNTCKLK